MSLIVSSVRHLAWYLSYQMGDRAGRPDDQAI
jgi:hypothetical protein